MSLRTERSAVRIALPLPPSCSCTFTVASLLPVSQPVDWEPVRARAVSYSSFHVFEPHLL